MRIEINGKEKILNADSFKIADILKIANVENPEMVVVQVNGEIVQREKITETSVKDGDKIEILFFMGGG
jgi:sulfur carrier protein